MMFLKRLLSYPGPKAIMFHHFHGGQHERSQGSLSANQLDDLIKWIGIENLVSADEWLASYQTGQVMDKICLTFDDGLLCQYDIARPVLEKYRLTAFWMVYSSVYFGKCEEVELFRYFRNTYFKSMDDFYQAFYAVVSKFINLDLNAILASSEATNYLIHDECYTLSDRHFRYIRDIILSKTQFSEIMTSMLNEANICIDTLKSHLWMQAHHLQCLDQSGHIIGLHSYSHPTRMELETAEVQQTEYQKNKAHLESVISQPIVSMSHPCDSYNIDTIRILKSLGIQIGFVANMRNIDDRNRFEIAREDHINLYREMTHENQCIY